MLNTKTIDMSAYKYSLGTGYNPFIQASVKSMVGRNYTYKGRLYCQVKDNGKISYADTNCNLNVKLVNWTTDCIDIELEVRDFKVMSDYNLLTSKCQSIVNSVAVLEESPLYIRVNNKGRILKILNVADVVDTFQLNSNSEEKIIEKLETNPLLSAFISGQIDDLGTSKVFASNIFEELNFASELQVECKKERFQNAKETSIVNKVVAFDSETQNKIFGDEKYNFVTTITSSKGSGRVLSYSIDYTTEEMLGEDYNVFVSVGLQKVVLEKDVSLSTKLYSTLLKNMSAIF